MVARLGDLKDEFFRLALTAYGFGKLDADEEIDKTLYRQGKPIPPDSPGALISGVEIVRLRKDAHEQAGAFADELMGRVRKALAGLLGPDGKWVTDRGGLARAVEEVFEPFLGEKRVVTFAEGRPRRIKIRDRGKWLEWQKTKKPYSKWIKSELKKRAKGVRPLSPAQLETRILTGYSKWYNRGQYVQGFERKEVVYFFFSALRDAKTCPLCRKSPPDKMLKPKAWRGWGRWTPPLHYRCRCRLVSVIEGEKPPHVKVTPESELKGIQPLEGFGGTARSTKEAIGKGVT